jgi:surface polysaccharide O-acyltransferase-like enzyme
MQSEKSNIRDSNFEFLRIISMFMIIIWHIGIHGISSYVDISNFLSGFNEILYYFICSLTVVSVSLYVLISGYFLSKSKKIKLNKLINLFIETSFFFYNYLSIECNFRIC